MPSGAFWYAVQNDEDSWISGTFDPSTGAAGAQGSFNAEDVESATVGPDGSFWVNNEGPLDCYASIAGGNAVESGFYPTAADGDEIYPVNIAVDSSGNLWYDGYDYSWDGDGQPPEYVGYFPTSACSIPESVPPAQFTLAGDYADYYTSMALLPNNGGVAVVSGYYYAAPTGMYIVNKSGPSTVNSVPALLSGSVGTSIAVDPAGTAYAAFSSNDPAVADIERLSNGGTSSSTLVTLPATPLPSSGPPGPYPIALNAFSATNAAADRLMYADTNYAAIGLVEFVQSSPMPLLAGLPNAAEIFGTAYSAKGGEYALDQDANANLDVARVLPTTTWAINAQIGGTCNQQGLLSIIERGDSGPFTVTAGGGVTAAAVPGTDHDYWLSLGNATSFTVTVTDAHGRSETFPVTSAQTEFCGTMHRRPRHVRRPARVR